MSTNGGQAWRAFMLLLQSQKSWMNEQISELDVTAQLAHALHVLSQVRETKMSDFADLMYCDASNATGLIDRLEARGLAERHALEADRRAKVVRLTAAGQRLDRRIVERLYAEAPPPIAKLSAADQRTLREILDRAVAHIESDRDTEPA